MNLIEFRAAAQAGEGKAAVLEGLTVNPNLAKQYLRQELGVVLENSKNRSLAKAISRPADFMEERENAMELATAKAAAAYTDYLQQLIDAGVPADPAKNTATAYAKTIYDAAMSIYEMTNPGYAQAIGAEKLTRQGQEGARDLLLGDKEQRRAYKQKVIQKYKAKKAAKKAK